MEHLVKLMADTSNIAVGVLIALCAGQYKMILDLMKARDAERTLIADALSKNSEAMNHLANAVSKLETIFLVRGDK